MNTLGKISIGICLILCILGTVSFAITGNVNAPSGLVLRETPSKGANPVTTVSDKAQVEIIEKDGEWYKVKYNNYEGYLFAEYVNAEEIPTEETKTDEEEQETENQTESNETENNEPEEKTESNLNTEYPQNVVINSNIDMHLIPVISSRIIKNIEQSKTITVNYILNEWANITYENTQGWVRKSFIIGASMESKEPIEEQKDEEEKPVAEENKQEDKKEEVAVENKKGYINVTTSANVRAEASTSSSVITTLTRNTEITVVGESGDFYKIKYKDLTGYISKSLISDNKLDEIETTSRSSTERNNTVDSAENSEVTVAASGSGQGVVDFAKQYLGYSYVYGGTTPSGGFDCTGFTYYVYNQCGYSLSRNCSAQANTGTAVSRENLQPGDLILFCNGSNGSLGHAAIYMGDGKIIHAANSRRGVTTDTIDSGYYNTYYYQARRIAN